jgi:OOP family OmpA-OmpF porin
MRRSLIASLALLFGVASAATAQAPKGGSVELGLFGRYSMYADALNADAGMGFGGRLGVHVGKGWAIEGEYATVAANVTDLDDQEITDRPLRVRVAKHFMLGARSRFILGAGYTRESWDTEAAASQSMSGAGFLAGVQFGFGKMLGLRIDGTYDMFGDGGAIPLEESGSIIGANAGLNFFFGSSGPKDQDKDGVLDEADACPGTPGGERVDARGCPIPKDADADGVIDANDTCAGTPAGEKVDAKGCPLPKDADADGVADATDRCAATPAGTAVDANGCPVDTDGDGVADTADRCAGTPAGAPVDANGCPRDADGDTVADNADRCPGTPAGTAVDASGCPLPDTDGDKVNDRDDKCAGTPTGMQVDATGCQKLFDAAAGKTTMVLTGVTFRSGSSVVGPSSANVLNQVADALNANPTMKVEIQGHTDNSGARAGNLRISQQRADAVRSYLISRGVDGSRLTAKGYGPDQPLVPNTTPAARTQNRRVELKQVP